MKRARKYLAVLFAVLLAVTQLPLTALAADTAADAAKDVAKIEFKPVSAIEQTNGYTVTENNPETGETVSYYKYNVANFYPEYTVTLKSGKRLTSSYEKINYKGQEYSPTYSDDQSAQNPWGVGKHTVTATLFGYTAAFEFEVVKTPVVSAEFETVQLIEGLDGYTSGRYNPETSDFEEYCQYSGYSCKNYTVTLADGTTLKSGESGSISYNGSYYTPNYSDDQSVQNPWGIGTHTAKATIMGYTADCPVEIVETVVADVKFENTVIIKNNGGNMVSSYDSATGNYVNYYKYSYDSVKCIITLKNGKRLEDGGNWLYYNNKSYTISYSDDQSAETPWDVGKHTVTANLLGYTATFEVEIIDSPYRILEILQVDPVTENQNCYENANGDLIYNVPRVMFRVTDKDGKSFIASSDTETRAHITSDQENSPWTVGGDNRFTLHYLDLSVEGKVEMQPGSPFEYFEQDGGLYITGYRISGQKSVEIPSQIDGKPVVGIIWSETDAENIIIPDSVKTIGESAFFYATQLKTLTVGSGVSNLNYELFKYLNNLSSITVSKNNPYFCDIDGIVYDKSGTKLVVYPLAKGDEYTVPANVTDIDILNDSVYNFLDITIADGSKMFVTVDGVTYNADKTRIISCDRNKSGEYVMPDTVTEISEKAFKQCTMLTSVKVSDKVTKIAYSAFEDCSSLNSVTLPSKLESINECAFYGCESLADITIPDTLGSVGYRAFFASGLEKISLPDSITDIDEEAFAYCNSLESVKLPNKLTYLADGLFRECVWLSDITIPDSVTSIGEYAFFYCTNLKDVYYSGNLSGWCKIEFYDYHSNPMIYATNLYINGKLLEGEITIPDSVTNIGNYTFGGCSGLTGITIPDSVTTIGDGAFEDCTGLTNVTIGNSVTSIGGDAFYGCAKLTSITIPDSVTSIGGDAFRGCTSLTEVIFTNPQISIGDGAFSNCPIKELNLPNGIKNAGNDFAFSGTDITKLVLPDSVTSIAYGNFADCTKLAEIDVPSTVMRVGGRAFDNTAWANSHSDGPMYLKHIFIGYHGDMPQNTKIAIKDGTTVIADYALEEQTALGAVTLPKGLRVIGMFAFYNCSEIKEIYIPASVTDIDPSAFIKCSSLTAINVAPDNPNYKSIDGVLYSKDGTKLIWCPKRTAQRYEVPDSVTEISACAFIESGVSAVKITNPNTQLRDYSIGYLYSEYETEYLSSELGTDYNRRGIYLDYKLTEIICPKDFSAYNYAKANNLLVTVPENIDIVSNNEEVSISATTDVASGNVSAKVIKKSTADINTSAINADRYNIENAAVYDITLEKNGVRIQPNGKIEVSIDAPKNSDGSKFTVLRGESDGTFTDMKATFKDGKLTFMTDHFSTYVVVENKIKLGDVNGDGKINVTDAILILRYNAEIETLTGSQKAAADVTGDKQVNTKDAIDILRYDAQLITDFQ